MSVEGSDGKSGSGHGGSVRAQRNLASAISRLRVKPKDLTADDLKLLAMEFILDQDSIDDGRDAQRARVQLDALKFIHEVRKDERAASGEEVESDFEVWKVRQKAP
jgi:hypothetical protein